MSIDRIDLSVPIVHGDLLHMDARVVKAGRSTVTVEVCNPTIVMLNQCVQPVLPSGPREEERQHSRMEAKPHRTLGICSTE